MHKRSVLQVFFRLHLARRQSAHPSGGGSGCAALLPALWQGLRRRGGAQGAGAARAGGLAEDGRRAKGVGGADNADGDDAPVQEHEHEQRAQGAAQGVAHKGDLGEGRGGQVLLHHRLVPVVQKLGCLIHAAVDLRSINVPSRCNFV